MYDRSFQTFTHEVAGCEHARLVRGVGISLGKDRETISQSDIRRPISGFRWIARPLRVLAIEIAIVIRLQCGSLLECRADLGEKSVAHERDDRRITGGMLW